MRVRLILNVLLSSILIGVPAFAKKDKSNDYQIGTFISSMAVSDGTITSTLHGDGTTVAGGVFANRVGVYMIRVPDGTWYVETMRQALDSKMRGLGSTPQHLKSEKANPLDSLNTGDKVLFRLETHKKMIGGPETDMYIPFATDPSKEVEFVTRFVPNMAHVEPSKQTDNVKAMCESGRLSAELQKLYCNQ